MQDDNWLLPEHGDEPGQAPQAPMPSFSSPFSDTDPALPPARPVTPQSPAQPKRRAFWLLGGLGGAAVALLLGSAVLGARAVSAANVTNSGAVAAAATATETPHPGKWGPGGPHMGNFATVSSVNGTTITAKDRKGQTVTIKTDANTKITRADQTIAVGDLKSGDSIAVRGTKNSDGSISATEIAVIPARVGGSVTAVGTNSFTVKGKDGSSHTVNVTNATTYHLGFQQTGSFNDVKVGANVEASGTTNSDGSLTASSVVIQVPSTGGQITQITGNTITVKGFKNNGATTSITVTDATTYYNAATKAKIALTDLKVGDFILAEGTAGANNTFAATAIVVAPGGFGRGHGPGGPGWPGKPENPTATPTT